jgi:hypothetical protein
MCLKVVKEVRVRVCSHEGGGALERGVSMRLFPNLRRTHEYKNLLPFCSKITLFLKISSLLSHSVAKRKFSMGTWEHIKITRSLWRHNKVVKYMEPMCVWRVTLPSVKISASGKSRMAPYYACKVSLLL